MAGGLGSLVLEIGANVARFTEDLGRMSAIAEANGKRMEAAFTLAGNALKSIAIGATALETFNYLREGIDKAIESSAGLVRLAERTGAAVENLSALAAVAKLSGTDTEEVATGLQKLAKAMADAGDGGAKTTAAFAAIGISVEQLKGQQPDQVFLKIAQQMALYADGTGKTVAAQELLGKSGARLLPVLKDLGDAGAYNATTTEAQALAAEEYEKTLHRLALASDALWRTISNQLVPVFDAFARALLETKTSADGIKGVVDGLAADNSIRDWAEGGAKAVAFVVDAFDGVARVALIAGKAIGASAAAASLAATGQFAAARNVIVAFGNDVSAILEKVQFSERLAKQIEESHKGQTAAPVVRPQIDPEGITGKGTKDTAAGVAKAIYEGQLHALAEFITAENQAFKTREEELKGLYDADQISIRYYFTTRQEAIAAHLLAVTNAYAEEIDQAEKYSAKLSGINAPIEKQQVATKIAELRAKSELAVADASEKSAATTREETKATEAYADSVTQLSITLAKMRGDLVAADLLEEELYRKQLARQATRGGNKQEDLDRVAALVQTKIYDDRITEQQQMLSQLEAREATVEGRIALQQQEGAIGGFQALAALGKAREDEIAQLEEVYQKYVKIAATAAPGEQQKQAQDNVDALRLKLDQLKATADPLGKTFSDAFQAGFISNLDKVIKGTETVGDAFRNMAIGIIDQILQIEEKNLAMSLFGAGAGGTSPWVSAFATAFAGSASGGNVSGGAPRIVGERGPELFTPHTDGYITPNHDLGKQQQNITVSPQIINVHDPSEIPTAMQSSAGEQAILNVITRNPSAIKSLLR